MFQRHLYTSISRSLVVPGSRSHAIVHTTFMYTRVSNSMGDIELFFSKKKKHTHHQGSYVHNIKTADVDSNLAF